MEVKPYDGAAAPLGVSLRFSLSLPLAVPVCGGPGSAALGGDYGLLCGGMKGGPG